MKIQGKMFLWLALFVGAIAIVYGLWSKEPVGTSALAMSFGLSLMIGFYLVFTAKRVDTGAGDNKDAEVADDAGELGFFSPHSWQPLALGAGCAMAFLGVVFGWWLLFVSLPLILVGIFGWTFEYYHGENQNQ